jgi:hypothetical protein
MTDAALTKRLTPTRAFRAMLAPYREKLEQSDAARGQLEGRLRRAFDLFDQEMRDIWGAQADDTATTAPDATTQLETPA